MRILVCGSWRIENKSGDLNEELFRKYCGDLGQALFNAGHKLIVCSAKKSTADRWIVEGAKTAAKKRRRKLELEFVLSRNARLQIEPDETQDIYEDPSVKVIYPASNDGWFRLYNRAMENCDAVIIVGGSDRGCGGAAYAALSKGLPLVAIPAFHGASERVYDDISDLYTDSRCPSNVIAGINSTTDTGVRHVVTLTEHLVKHNPFTDRTSYNLKCSMLIHMVIIWIVWVGILLFGSKIPLFQMLAAFAAFTAGLITKFARGFALEEDIPRGDKLVLESTVALGSFLGILVVGSLAYQAFGDNPTNPKFQALSSIGLGAGLLTEQYFGVLTKGLSKPLKENMKES